MSVEIAVDQLVSMNVNEESYACLQILNKYFMNGAKPEEKYRRIKKTNDVYQVIQHFTFLRSTRLLHVCGICRILLLCTICPKGALRF